MKRPFLAIVLSVWLAVILAATLIPTGDRTSGFSTCVFCAPRATADGLGNIALFAPLGATLSALGFGALGVFGIGAVISAMIELAQLGVPGRDPGISDLITNAAGAAVGALALVPVARWMNPPAALRPRLTIAAAVIAAAVWFATGWLVTPSFETASYWGQWTPVLHSMQPYRGRVLAASLGGTHVPSEHIADSEGLRDRLARREPILLRVRTGPPPTSLSDIFSIADSKGRRVLLVGAIHEDVVLRYRTRAADWRLDQPDIRIGNALGGVPAGVEIQMNITTAAAGLCVDVAGRQTCGLGYGPGDGWSLLLHSTTASLGARRVLQALWMAALVVPAGFWCARNRATWFAVAVLAAGMIVAPLVTHVLPAKGHEWAGTLAGLLTGAIAGAANRRVRAAS